MAFVATCRNLFPLFSIDQGRMGVTSFFRRTRAKFPQLLRSLNKGVYFTIDLMLSWLTLAILFYLFPRKGALDRRAELASFLTWAGW